MVSWHVFSDDHEIPGQLFFDLQHAIGAEEIMPFFVKHGLTNIDPHAWYPMQDLLNVYNDMANTKGGTMFDFISIGVKVSEQAYVPDEFASLPLPIILKGSEQVFKLNNRGSDIGETSVEVLGDKHVKIIMRVPQPDDLWYGVYYGYVKRFAPPGTSFTIAYDPDVLRRDLGGEKTVFDIKWK